MGGEDPACEECSRRSEDAEGGEEETGYEVETEAVEEEVVESGVGKVVADVWHALCEGSGRPFAATVCKGFGTNEGDEQFYVLRSWVSLDRRFGF